MKGKTLAEFAAKYPDYKFHFSFTDGQGASGFPNVITFEDLSLGDISHSDKVIVLGSEDEDKVLAMTPSSRAELDAYRATGLTPSMVKDLIASSQKHHKNALENAHIVDDYQAIGTVEEFLELKKLQDQLQDRIQMLRNRMFNSWKDLNVDALIETLEEFSVDPTVPQLRR